MTTPPPFELPPPDVRFGAALDSLARYSGAAVRQCIAERDAWWQQQTEALRAAAQAVVERWDTPLWKDAPHTGEFITRLRDALSTRTKEQTHGR